MRPPASTRPEVGLMIPETRRSSVDLPEPFRPTSPTASPGSTVQRDVAQRLHLARAEATAGDERRPSASAAPSGRRGTSARPGRRRSVRPSHRLTVAPGPAVRAAKSARDPCPGSTPWPRLKMWPGRPPARRSTSRAARLDALPRAEQRGGVEIPLHAAVAATSCPALVERDPPVEADHVAAGARHRRQQRRGPGAEVDRRRARRRRGSGPTTAPRTRS